MQRTVASRPHPKIIKRYCEEKKNPAIFSGGFGPLPPIDFKTYRIVRNRALVEALVVRWGGQTRFIGSAIGQCSRVLRRGWGRLCVKHKRNGFSAGDHLAFAVACDPWQLVLIHRVPTVVGYIGGSTKCSLRRKPVAFDSLRT